MTASSDTGRLAAMLPYADVAYPRPRGAFGPARLPVGVPPVTREEAIGRFTTLERLGVAWVVWPEEVLANVQVSVAVKTPEADRVRWLASNQQVALQGAGLIRGLPEEMLMRLFRLICHAAGVSEDRGANGLMLGAAEEFVARASHFVCQRARDAEAPAPPDDPDDEVSPDAPLVVEIARTHVSFAKAARANAGLP